MNRADLAAEVLRIHDLITAGAGAQSRRDWKQVITALAAVNECAIQHWGDATEEAKPQPLCSRGMGACTSLCDSFEQEGNDWDLARCKISGIETRSGVPCRPWVEGKMRELGKQIEDWQDVVQYERQAAATARAELHRCKTDGCRCEVPR